MRLLAVIKIVGAAVAAVVALLVLVWLFQRRLIYLPLEHDVPPVESVLTGGEEVVCNTADGLALSAWFLRADRLPARATVLVLHGNAGHRAHRAPLAAALARRGYSVLLLDYRGYGGNPGRPSESGLLEDARAARRWLLARDDVDPARLVYFGESLGAAVAVALAVEQPPAALVLRSPFTSLVAIGALHYPFLPVRTLLVERYPSIERVPRLGCPLLILAGAADRIVPVDESRRLYDAAASDPKRFVSIEGADHNDYELLAGERLLEALQHFWLEVGGTQEGERP